MTHRARVHCSVQVGSVQLPNPIMVASGTAGHSTELSAYLDLAKLGAFVVKSLSAEPWAGNPSPRLSPVGTSMINSIGLQGPGVTAWLNTGYQALRGKGVERIVVSIWGRTVEEYAAAAALLADAPPEVIAVEVNLSCPNLDGGAHLFAHDPDLSAAVITACSVANRPLWAKLSPNTHLIPQVADAVASAGAEAVTLTNTLLGLAIDCSTRKPTLAMGGGGLSGPGIHPVALRAVYDCRRAHPNLPIIGVGGIGNGEQAVEFLLAGAHACQVGTATFADPRAPLRVLEELQRWCDTNGVNDVRELIGESHG